MAESMHILGFAGSLRKKSYNRALLAAAEELLPEGMSLEIYDLANIPLYNADLEADLPEPVRHFKERIAAADALLIATPEYNYSVPGVLKNAIDWASRPPRSSPLNGKVAAMMGASTGNFGTVRAQLHLRQIFVFTDTLTVVKPEIYIPRCEDKFDEQGRLLDEELRARIKLLLMTLGEWVGRMKRGT